MKEHREPRYQPYLLSVRERVALSWAAAGTVIGVVIMLAWALSDAL